jgi:hypothetical protein
MNFKEKLQEAVNNHHITDFPGAGAVFGCFWGECGLRIVIRCKHRTVRIINLHAVDALPDLIAHYSPDQVFLDISAAPPAVKRDIKYQAKYDKLGYTIIIDTFARCNDICLIAFHEWIDKKRTICREIQEAYEKNDITYKAFLMSFLDIHFKRGSHDKKI